MVEYDVPTAIANSGFLCKVDENECIACGDCVERCPFGALSVPDDVCVVDSARCVGCGVCIIACPSDALSLERLPEEELVVPPVNLQDWTERKAQARGLSQ